MSVTPMQQAINLRVVTCYSYDFSREQYGPEEIEINLPTKCSHCSHVGSQVHVSSVYTYNTYERGKSDLSDVITIMGCPFCHNHTIHLMSQIPRKDNHEFNPSYYHQFFRTIPSIESTVDFPESVGLVSSDFVKIYKQALEAESNNLSEIAGMGFRKALEFLVTDYLLGFSPEEKETLENPKTSLGKKINMLPEDLHLYAKASSYLGNDETHYSRRHPELGISDLKAFIDLVVIEIERDVAREKAKNLLDKP